MMYDVDRPRIGDYTWSMISVPIELIRAFFPAAQAIYLFGSCCVGTETRESDADIALLLPHQASRSTGSLAMSPLRFQLEKELKRTVDLVNLRLVSTVFQKEIIGGGVCVYIGDEQEVDLFEMITLSKYIKLNEERAALVSNFYATGRAY
jgi:predicted nucleotidyltransferase